MDTCLTHKQDVTKTRFCPGLKHNHNDDLIPWCSELWYKSRTTLNQHFTGEKNIESVELFQRSLLTAADSTLERISPINIQICWQLCTSACHVLRTWTWIFCTKCMITQPLNIVLLTVEVIHWKHFHGGQEWKCEMKCHSFSVSSPGAEAFIIKW